ncbi:MAG: HD domain-containing protein [Gemmatimonadaceae bacterium]|nr:HD domain-containing protein [Gemmatimonadaceae bacterium]
MPDATQPSTPAVPHAGDQAVPVSEVLASLSRALDLTEGQPLGHSVRSCVIGMRLGREAGLGEDDLAELYYALLLKDAGCSSNAARLASVFGSDDHAVKPRLKTVDWDDRMALAVETWRASGMRQSLGSRLRYFLGVARQEHMARDVIATRCERGAEIARRLGFPKGTVEAIRSLDEHWNGNGHPEGRSGEAIPLLSRILNIAQTIEVFWASEGPEATATMLRDRRGRWFDPTLTDRAVAMLPDPSLWVSVQSPDVDALVVAMEPVAEMRRVGARGLDDIARAYADIIDAKSPFTFRHSSQVAAYATAIGEQLRFDAATMTRTRRAALLHDIGKVGVSNRILDKNGPLDLDERAAIERHPLHTWEILRRISAFADFARQAATHHEKLDGTGYPWNLGADELDLPSRALVVADIYEALTASRPYRDGMSVEKALGILERDKGTRLDASCVDALAAVVTRDAGEDSL